MLCSVVSVSCWGVVCNVRVCLIIDGDSYICPHSWTPRIIAVWPSIKINCSVKKKKCGLCLLRSFCLSCNFSFMSYFSIHDSEFCLEFEFQRTKHTNYRVVASLCNLPVKWRDFCVLVRLFCQKGTYQRPLSLFLVILTKQKQPTCAQTTPN